MQVKKESAIIKIAKIVNVHGIRGAVKVKLFIEEHALFNNFEQILDSKASPIPIKLIKKHKDHWLAEIDTVKDRDGAEALKGTELYVYRSSFPDLEEDEFYFFDLIGFTAFDLEQNKIGTVSAFHDYGEASLVEIEVGQNDFFNVEFSKNAVPKVDLKNKSIVVDISQKIDVI